MNVKKFIKILDKALSEMEKALGKKNVGNLKIARRYYEVALVKSLIQVNR